MSAHLTLGRAAMQADAALRAASAADRDDDSPPPSPPRLSGRLSSSNVSENEPPPLPLEDIAALVTTSRNAAASAATPSTKPKLAVSASGRFQDQFYHAQEASRTVGLFKNRAIVKQSADGNRSDAPPKRKKSINVNGRDVEQFSDSDIIYSGYLVKQGSFWKTWKRRYFILRRDINVLAYYTSQENLVKLGEVTIDGTTKITPPNPADKAFPGRFIVEHSERKLVLVADDRSAADTWTMVLKRCVNTRAQEAEAAAAAARGTSELETIRSSLMQLRLSANDSLLATKRHSGSGHLMVAPAASVDSPRVSDVEPKRLPPPRPPAPPASNTGKPQLVESKSDELPPPPAVEETPTLSKVKRHSTDSRVIQAAADEAAMQRAKSAETTERERIVRTARLKSIDSANDTERKKRSSSKEIGSVGLKPRRLFRSYSAGSVLSTRSIGYNDVRLAHDDCGLRTSLMTSRNNHPTSNKHLRSSEGRLSVIGADNSKETTRSRNLSLPAFRPAPSIELSVSVGSRGTQEMSHMIVVLSAIFPEERGTMKELARTEVQGSLALRPCGADFYVRDFSSLLSVPLSGGQNTILHFEIFAVMNLSTEALTHQLSLGFVRISHVDLLFSGDSTLVLECIKSRTSPSKQYHFLTVDRVRPSETLNLGHSYLYAKRHFVADIVPFDLRQGSSSDFVAVLSSPDNSWSAGDRRPSQANTSPTLSAPPSSSRGSTLSYSDMMRGNVDSTEASQVFISEELSSSYCSISVAAKYMNLVQVRNQRRIHDAKILIADIEHKYEQMPSSPNSRTECGDIIDAHLRTIQDAEERIAHYTKLYKAYVECEDYYDVLLAMLEDGKEPGITGSLKRSTQKKDKRTEFMPTNLNCHVVRARRVVLSTISNNSVKEQGTRERNTGAKGDELVYAVITHGCPAAHCLGFKDGGLRRLQQTLAQGKDDIPLKRRVEQRQDVVRCQILAIASAAFLTVIGLAANQSARHQERLELMCRTGFLLSMESLLSTIKNEKGMIEDMVAGVQWLNDAVSLQVVQSLEENPKLKCAKCIGITSSENGDHVVATFALPSEVYAVLPDMLRHGHALKISAVMFTQGINEMQSVANTVFDTSLQDEINYESANRLVKYFDTYKKHVLEMQPQNPERIKDLPDLEIEIKILAEKLNLARRSHVQKKNVNILIESSDLCRRLGAGRSTCCKSGKDRTAMSVTLECSRLLVDKFHVKQGVHLTNAMRERGVRRINVLANTGKNKFAFNNFQLKYLPDCYRPPVLAADSGVQS